MVGTVYTQNLRSLITEEIANDRISRDAMASRLGVSYPTLNGWLQGADSPKMERAAEEYLGQTPPIDRDTTSSVAARKTAGPPALPGFSFSPPTVVAHGQNIARIRIANDRCDVTLYAAVRSRLGVKKGDRVYIYLSDDRQRIAIVKASQSDVTNSVHVCVNGEVICRWLHDDLVAAGWTSCSVTPEITRQPFPALMIERPR